MNKVRECPQIALLRLEKENKRLREEIKRIGKLIDIILASYGLKTEGRERM